MNTDESDKLDEIHEDVQETRTSIQVIDERTRHIESRMDSIRSDVDGNIGDIDDLQDDVRRNKTILGGVGAGLTAIALWAADKVTRFL